MVPLSFYATLLFSGLATARVCQNLLIPVEISARQGVFKNVPAEGNLDTGAFAVEFLRNGRNYTATLLQGYQTVRGNYNISASYCQPDKGPGDTVQLLSHGIGFDKTYWDLSYNNYNYSYVDTVVKQGYSTLAIDRLGIGSSSHGDPINFVQAPAEIEALNAVTTLLRQGKVVGIGKPFRKVIHVGHSFGSVQSYWLSSLYPNNTDGLVLTGFSASSFLGTTVAAWDLHSARLNQPFRLGNVPNRGVLRSRSQYLSANGLLRGIWQALRALGIEASSQDIWNEIATTEVGNIITGYNQTGCAPLNYPSGYLVPADLTATQFVFLNPGFFDVGLAVLSEQTKQPVTIGEILTIGSFPSSSAITGPVLIFTGENDQPFCGFNCYAATPSIPAGAKAIFPQTSYFEALIQPNTGHALTVHYNATAGYKAISGWLAAHGLPA